MFQVSKWPVWGCAWWEDRGRALWTWLGTDHDQVKILFAVIAALYILWEYHDKQVEYRVSKTYDFQVRLASNELQKARLDLNLLLISNKPAIDAAGSGGSDLIASLVHSNQMERNVLLLADFYSQVADCSKLNLCELDVACQAFREPVIAFRNNFYPLFDKWKKDWGNDFIAEPFEYFRTSCSESRSWKEWLTGWLNICHIFG